MESVGGKREEAGDARWVSADKVVSAVSHLEAAVVVGSGVLGGGVIAAGFTREGKGVDGKSDDGGGDGVQVAAAVVKCDGKGNVVDVGGLVVADGGAGIGGIGGILAVTAATFDDSIGVSGAGAVGGVEGAGGVDDASGVVVGGVAAVAVDIAGMCGTDGAGNVDDICIAVAVVVGSVIFIIEVQRQVSGCEVGAKEASMGGGV